MTLVMTLVKMDTSDGSSFSRSQIRLDARLSRLAQCAAQVDAANLASINCYIVDITRELRARIFRAAAQFPAVVLTGARQTGKTTLLRRLFPSHSYVSLDLPSAAELAERSPEQFLRAHPGPLLIDEVQYAPMLFRHLKIAIDADRHHMGQFILTGSQKFVLMKEVADSLAGRAALMELETLSLTELTAHLPWPSDMDSLVHHMVRGGFPELWRDTTIDSREFYRSYLATYLERDVRQILNVTSLRDFERFIRACAARSAGLLDKSSISRDVGVSAKAIGDWLSVLEASNQVHFLEPYFENISKRLIKSPKLHFSDTGLLCFLLGLDEQSLPTSPYLGAIWETFVYSELRKVQNRQATSRTLWFYRDGAQREVAFMVVAGNRIDLVEAKWGENPGARDALAMEAVAATLIEKGSRTEVHSAIVCRTPHSSIVGSQTSVVSLGELIRAITQAGVT
jgi:uncharacterized protein